MQLDANQKIEARELWEALTRPTSKAALEEAQQKLKMASLAVRSAIISAKVESWRASDPDDQNPFF